MYAYILGATYSSNIGIDDIHDIQDIDISPMVISIASSPLLFFDLETTGLGLLFLSPYDSKYTDITNVF